MRTFSAALTRLKERVADHETIDKCKRKSCCQYSSLFISIKETAIEVRIPMRKRVSIAVFVSVYSQIIVFGSC